MGAAARAFHVGSVRVYQRGKVWYLSYHEDGLRRRPRVGPDKDAARKLAAQVNAQLAVSAPTAFSFEQIALHELRARWLQHHEHVLRSSVATIDRYRTATDHLLRFVQKIQPVRSAAGFKVGHAEHFVRYLRTIQVSPNGHPNSSRRPLLDKGVKYILEACRTLFNFAIKRRHLPPYSDNPFMALELAKVPVETCRPIHLMTAEQERNFLAACDDWQFPLFLTLLFTGLRPGELSHLLLPDDLDLERQLLFVRNKPKLGWQVKTRNEREIPLVTPLAEVLQLSIRGRRTGPVFRRRQFEPDCYSSGLASLTTTALEAEVCHRIEAKEALTKQTLTRRAKGHVADRLWRGIGSVSENQIRLEFMKLTRLVNSPDLTSPKLLRHMFATRLQDANVDPLIRNELMGHAPGAFSGGSGLGMTANYTHTRPETRRRQLELALESHSAIEIATNWTNSVGQKIRAGSL